MKMVVAYVEPGRYEQIREDLLGLGFPSLSVVSASGSLPEATVSATYRGTAIEGHSRPKARLECVVGADHASTVVDTVLADGGDRSFVFVLPVEQAYPAEMVVSGDTAVPAG